MAVLGAQLVITLVMASVIQKLGRHFSLAKTILCSTGLYRYLYPTDDELKTLAGIQKNNRKHKNNAQNGKPVESFHIAKNLQFELETAPVVDLDLVHLRFFPEFQWLLDFSLWSTIVYGLTEICSTVVNMKEEVNLSVLWCLLVVGFSLKCLFQLTKQYFDSEDSGERSTVIVTSFLYLVLSMIILIVDENSLELGLETAYVSFNSSAASFLEHQGIHSSGPASKIVIKFFLAVWCGLIGALFTFPGLRVARMHWDALKYYNNRRLLRLLMNISFVLPFLITLLWVKPITRDYLTVRVFHGMDGPLLRRTTFESGRLVLIILAVLLRLSLMPLYLQSYLNMAARRVESLRKEAGRITNVDLQKKVAAVFYYLCVVALQFIAPLLICFFLTCLYKTLGGYTWTGEVLEGSDDQCPKNPPPVIDLNASTIRESAQQFTLALDSLKQVFTIDVYRGLFGLFTWWTCFAWCSTTFLGYIYQSYFSQI